MQGLRVPGSYIDQNHPEGVISDRYFRGSGTSEAAAITSGVVALLLDKYPDLTPDQVKWMLTDSAQLIPGFDDTFQGSGAINLPALASEQDPNNWGRWRGSYTQSFPSSNGAGSVEASRGGDHLTQNGVMLTGNQDIFGNPFDSRSMAQDEADASSWSGGWWNGSLWAGNSWSGSSWSSVAWTGSSWSGSSWSGSSWSGNSWSGSSWSGSSWSGSSWSGSSWSGDEWAGVGWS